MILPDVNGPVHAYNAQSSVHTRADNPLAVDTFIHHVESWLAQPQVQSLHPGRRHASMLFDLRRLGSAGNLTTDAHLAALAIEHQAEVYTTDADFARFSGLRTFNPVQG